MGPAVAIPGPDLKLVGGPGSEVVDGVLTMVRLVLVYKKYQNLKCFLKLVLIVLSPGDSITIMDTLHSVCLCEDES